MSNFPYINPSSPNLLSIPEIDKGRNFAFTPPQGYVYGTHFSIYGIGGYMEVQNLSDLHISSNTIPINAIYDISGNPFTIILNNDNVSSGRRKLGMLVYVYQTDTIYQFYIPNYNTAFNTATGSSSYERRYVSFEQYETLVYPNSATTLLISGWTGSTIEGVNGVTRDNASWRKLSFSGTSSGGTVSGSGTTNYVAKWINNTTLGDSQIYNDGSNVVISVQTIAPSFSGTNVYLGDDSSGNTRTINADSVILDLDVLNGGTY